MCAKCEDIVFVKAELLTMFAHIMCICCLVFRPFNGFLLTTSVDLVHVGACQGMYKHQGKYTPRGGHSHRRNT